MKITNKWFEISKIYKRFAKDYNADFSEKAALEMFNHESKGFELSENNGFALGKKWMDVNISAWKEDIASGLLYKYELYKEFPAWWLDRVIGSCQQGTILTKESFKRRYAK